MNDQVNDVFPVEDIPFVSKNDTKQHPYARFPFSTIKRKQSFAVPESMRKTVQNAIQADKRKFKTKQYTVRTRTEGNKRVCRVFRLK